MADTKAQVVRAHRLTRVVGALLGMCAFSSANAASFDCVKAVSRIDNAICASPRVSRLDDDLEPVYLAVLASSTDPNAIRTAQRAWLKTTRNQCQDEACFISVYEQRIAALTAVAPKSFLEAKANVEAEDAADKNLAADEALSAAPRAAREEEQKVAEQAIAAASAAQAQKVAEQVAAAASAVRAREMAEQVAVPVLAAKAKDASDKAEADVKSGAEQRRPIVITGGIAIFVVVAIGWLLWRRRTNATTVKPKETDDPVPNVKPSVTQSPKSVALSRQDDIAELSEALNTVNQGAFKPSSTIQSKATEASKYSEEKLGRMNEARQWNNTDGATEPGVDTARVVAKPFWSRLTGKQIALLVGSLVVLLLLAIPETPTNVCTKAFIHEFLKTGSDGKVFVDVKIDPQFSRREEIDKDGNGLVYMRAGKFLVHNNEAIGDAEKKWNRSLDWAYEGSGGGWNHWACNVKKIDGNFQVTDLHVVSVEEINEFDRRRKK